ncbi:hypothetical protein [Thiolapillus sp.]
MNKSNNKKGKIIFALFSVMLMSSQSFAQEETETSLEEQIVLQGDMALSQMKTELGRNAFWRQSVAEQLARQLDEQVFAPATAATTDCEQENIAGDEKKTPLVSPVTTGQPG